MLLGHFLAQILEHRKEFLVRRAALAHRDDGLGLLLLLVIVVVERHGDGEGMAMKFSPLRFTEISP